MHAALESIGQVFLGFEVTQRLPIPELQATLIELVHLQTGARVLHLANEDPENVFCLSFQTLPRSSNGVAHILEHTVLCGSERFPVKDPFFAMTRRSLHTFMNAFTGADFTCYPASSQVEKDFYNLLDVYLDSVFYPKLRRLSFLQEGHRLEIVDGKVQFQGVVYNEMKGALSSPDTRLWYAVHRNLLPDLPYAFESGGTPAEIPNLTYEELQSFHEEYYSPSRCIFYFYGNIPLQKHLHFIEEKVLQKAHKLPLAPPIPRQKRFHSPIRAVEHYPVGEKESTKKKSYIAFSWLTVPISHQLEILALCLLDSIWFETDASYLKMALLKSGLCQEIDSSIDDEMSEIPFTIICKGCDPKNEKKLEKLLFQILEEFASKEIEPKRIEAALYQLEMERSEISGDGWPFGLGLFFRAGLLRAHGCPPQLGLLIHTLFRELREAIQNPDFLPSLIRTHFLNNPHRVTVTMLPDPNLGKKEAADESEALAKIDRHLSADQRQKIIAESKELLQYQEETERQSLDCLPKVALRDLPREPQDFALVEKGAVYHHSVFTNEFTYADLAFDLPSLTKEELPFAPLLAQLWTDVGYGKKTYEESQFDIEEITGGLDGSLSIHIAADQIHPTFVLRGKSLDRKNGRLLQLMGQFAKTPRFDEKERILEWFGQHAEELESSRVRRAMGHASSLALSGNSTASYLQNEWYGLPYLTFIETLKKDKKGRWIEKLAPLAKKLVSNRPTLILSCSEAAYKHLEQIDFAGLLKDWDSSETPWKPHFSLPRVKEQVHSIAAPVAFTALGMQTVDYSAPLLLSTELFSNTILHKEIREKGGAYGSGATYSTATGNFHFHSYRDPHLSRTLEVFEKAVEKIGRGDFTADELEEAKIGLIGSFDKPVPPGRRGAVAYGWLRSGRTLEKRRAFRHQLLDATIDDIARAVQQHIAPAQKTFVSLLGQELWEKEKARFPSMELLLR